MYLIYLSFCLSNVCVPIADNYDGEIYFLFFYAIKRPLTTTREFRERITKTHPSLDDPQDFPDEIRQLFASKGVHDHQSYPETTIETL